MEHLIKEARAKIPFGLSFDGFCEGRCDECPEKLLEFLDIELLDRESRLKRGEIPSAADIGTVDKMCKDVYSILQEKGLAK